MIFIYKCKWQEFKFYRKLVNVAMCFENIIIYLEDIELMNIIVLYSFVELIFKKSLKIWQILMIGL